MALVTGVNQGFLAIDHELVVAKIAAYYDVAGTGECANGVVVEGIALDESDLRARGDLLRELAGITAVSANGDILAFEQMRYKSFGELSGDTGDSNGESHSWYGDDR